jgi:hypothetical protein
VIRKNISFRLPRLPFVFFSLFLFFYWPAKTNAIVIISQTDKEETKTNKKRWAQSANRLAPLENRDGHCEK